MGTGQSGGKHGPVSTKRFPIPNDAGVEREFHAAQAGVKREFKGSDLREYIYTRIINGIKFTRTVTAPNVKVADRIASILGFTSNDRAHNRKRKRKH